MLLLLAEAAEGAGMTDRLRRQGYDVHRVMTGAEAVRVSRQADVVVLDLDVPGQGRSTPLRGHPGRG